MGQCQPTQNSACQSLPRSRAGRARSSFVPRTHHPRVRSLWSQTSNFKDYLKTRSNLSSRAVSENLPPLPHWQAPFDPYQRLGSVSIASHPLIARVDSTCYVYFAHCFRELYSCCVVLAHTFMACLCRAERKTLHLAKRKLPDGRGELVKEDSLGLLACLDLVELQRDSSRFALEFSEIEKSRDLVKTAESHVPHATLPSVQVTATAGYWSHALHYNHSWLRRSSNFCVTHAR